MIELARFPTLPQAQLFSHALQGAGIEHRVVPHGRGGVVLLRDAERFQEARALLLQWTRNVQEGAPAADNPWLNQPLKSADQPPLFSGRWLASMGPVTRAVLVTVLVCYGLQMLRGMAFVQGMLFPSYLELLLTQPWRAITPMFLHFGLLHLVFNLLWWVDLGRTIERYQSSTQLLLVTLVTAAVSSVAQFLWSGPNFGGLSGVVYGLLGYLWIYGRVNPAAGYGLRREIVIFMLIWMVVCMVGLPDVVANAAHLAGLVSGCLLGAATGLARRRQARG